MHMTWGHFAILTNLSAFMKNLVHLFSLMFCVFTIVFTGCDNHTDLNESIATSKIAHALPLEGSLANTKEDVAKTASTTCTPIGGTLPANHVIVGYSTVTPSACSYPYNTIPSYISTLPSTTANTSICIESTIPNGFVVVEKSRTMTGCKAKTGYNNLITGYVIKALTAFGTSDVVMCNVGDIPVGYKKISTYSGPYCNSEYGYANSVTTVVIRRDMPAGAYAICGNVATPSGAVLVGNGAPCAFQTQPSKYLKAPAAVELICVDSPMPSGYVLTEKVQAAALNCSQKGFIPTYPGYGLTINAYRVQSIASFGLNNITACRDSVAPMGYFIVGLSQTNACVVSGNGYNNAGNTRTYAKPLPITDTRNTPENTVCVGTTLPSNYVISGRLNASACASTTTSGYNAMKIRQLPGLGYYGTTYVCDISPIPSSTQIIGQFYSTACGINPLSQANTYTLRQK